MKFDIVHAFELNELEMELIYGGGGAPLGLGGGGGLGVGAGEGFSGSAANEARLHSYAVFCDRNLFSTNRASNEAEVGAFIPVLSEANLFSIGNPVSQVCLSNN